MRLQLLAMAARRWSSLTFASSFSHYNLHVYGGSVKDCKSVSPTSSSNLVISGSERFEEDAVLEAISSYGNDWACALQFFNWVSQECQVRHTVNTYNHMINILGKFFEFSHAWHLIRQMAREDGISPDHITFRTMFKRFAAAHLVQEAIDAYDRAEEFGLKDDTTFFNLIDSLCEYKHVIEAQELCTKKNVESSQAVKIQNLILRGWFKLGWWGKCREFWGSMERSGVPLDLHSYSIYMNILCKSGKPWKAINLYKKMKKKMIKLDIVAYNTILLAMGLCSGADASIRIYKEMVELQCRPNVVTYNTIIKFLCEGGRVRQAYEFLQKMAQNDCAPNAITYHCFFRFLTRPREIMQLFDNMLESGTKPRSETYIMLIKKFGRWGFLRPVFVIWNMMKKHGLSPDTFAYNALIDALLQKGMVEMARKYDEEMVAKGLSAKPRRGLGTKALMEGPLDS